MKRLAGRFGAIGSAIGLLAAFAWVALTQGPMAAPKVVLAEARQGAFAPQVFGIGTVEARRSYAVGPVQAGRLTRVLVDQGDRVTRGQTLAEIDPIDLDERLAAARSALARAKYVAATAAGQLGETQARQRAAEASANRHRDLLRVGFVSHEAVDAKQAEADAASAAVAASGAAQAAAMQEIVRADADVSALQKQRGHLRLASPVDGVVTARDAEPGNTVVAGQAVVRVIDPASVWVRARIDQGQAGAIAPGQTARIVLRSQRDRVLRGKVVRSELYADPVTEERLVDVAFDDARAGWSIGELAEVTIELARVDAALLVPTQAVQRLGQQSGVWRLENGRVRFVAIRSGTSAPDGSTEILDGLSPDDSVVAYSEQALQPDMRVRAVPALAAAAR